MTSNVIDSDRKVIVVLGAYGDGGALLSDVLYALGVDMADLTAGRDSDDEGSSGRPRLLQIYDELSALIDCPVSRLSHVLPFPAAWWRRKDAQALKLELVAYVRDELARSNHLWGFEDPRTARFLPLWWEVFRELSLSPIYIHAIRCPGASPATLSPEGVPPWSSGGELLWLSYNYDIVRYVTSKEAESVLVVDYDEWFVDGAAVARKLASELQIADSLFEEDYGAIVDVLLRDKVPTAEERCSPTLREAGMLYKSLVEGRWGSGDDRSELNARLRDMEALFASIRPILTNLETRISTLENENRRALRAVRATTEMLERSAKNAKRLADAK
jgi:hypothetical protein